MDIDALLTAAPATLPVSSARREVTYELASDLVAVHDVDPGAGGEAGAVVDERISVRPSRRAAAEAQARGGGKPLLVGPVYRRQGGPDVVVPTGRVLVRFPEGAPAEAYAGAIRTAGYAVVEVLGYAPHAAWVADAGGDIVAALRHLSRLEALPGVVHVEPQMLGQRSHRS